jgi:hypothetical protein
MTAGALTIRYDAKCTSQVNASIVPDINNQYCVVSDDPRLLSVLLELSQRSSSGYPVFQGCYQLDAGQSLIKVSDGI